MVPHNDSPAGEAGEHSLVWSGLLRQIRFCCNRQVANATGRARRCPNLEARLELTNERQTFRRVATEHAF